jgi:hypothetical protein
MSLDVYLTEANRIPEEPEARIFIREAGMTKQITRAEWDQRYPNQEPVTFSGSSSVGNVYERNITHNLNQMAEAAGIYNHLWRPDEIGITNAEQLIAPLRDGLEKLRSDPSRFSKFNPENGWGSYDGLIDFVADYLAACEAHPGAAVSVSR